eukprot:NODE_727_length_4406_cov_0.729046.p1 type:complete len:379 gc:universal NODE_727_length_4406_cov_0.729046:433-1569(+)
MIFINLLIAAPMSFSHWGIGWGGPTSQIKTSGQERTVNNLADQTKREGANTVRWDESAVRASQGNQLDPEVFKVIDSTKPIGKKRINRNLWGPEPPPFMSKQSIAILKEIRETESEKLSAIHLGSADVKQFIENEPERRDLAQRTEKALRYYEYMLDLNAIQESISKFPKHEKGLLYNEPILSDLKRLKLQESRVNNAWPNQFKGEASELKRIVDVAEKEAPIFFKTTIDWLTALKKTETNKEVIAQIDGIIQNVLNRGKTLLNLPDFFKLPHVYAEQLRMIYGLNAKRLKKAAAVFKRGVTEFNPKEHDWRRFLQAIAQDKSDLANTIKEVTPKNLGDTHFDKSQLGEGVSKLRATQTVTTQEVKTQKPKSEHPVKK